MDLIKGMKFKNMANKVYEIINVDDLKVTYKIENGSEDSMYRDMLEAYLKEYPNRVVYTPPIIKSTNSSSNDKAMLKVWKRSTFAGGASFPDGTMGTIEKIEHWNLKDDEYVFTPDGELYDMDQFKVNEQEIVKL